MTITLYVSIHTQNKCFPLSKMRPLAKEKRSRTRTFRDNALNQFHRSCGLSSLRQTQTARERGPVPFQAERIFRQSITDHAAYERTAFLATGSLKKAQLTENVSAENGTAPPHLVAPAGQVTCLEVYFP